MKKSAYKWLMLLAVLLLSGCSAAKEPSTAALSYGSSSAKEHSSSSVDVVPSSDVSQPEKLGVDYAFPFVEENDWEQGDYKINVGRAIEKRSENDQEWVFTFLELPGEQMLGKTAVPLLLEESRYLSSEAIPDSSEAKSLVINGSIEVYPGNLYSFMNGLFAAWEFHSDSEYFDDLAPDYYKQMYSFELLNGGLWRNEMQLDLNALNDIRTLPAGVTWNPLSEQYIMVYGADDAIYSHSTSEYDYETGWKTIFTKDPYDYYISANGEKIRGNRLSPNHRLAIAVFDSEGKLVKEMTSQEYYWSPIAKYGSPSDAVGMQILSKQKLLLQRSSLSGTVEGNNYDDLILVDLDQGTFNRLTIESSYYDHCYINLKTEELQIRGNIFTFSKDGAVTSKESKLPMMKLEEQDGHTVLVPAKVDDGESSFNIRSLVPYSAVSAAAGGPVKIPGMPMLDKTDLYCTAEKDGLILLMKYPWAQPEKMEAVYGFQKCNEKCSIEFTYADQDGTVYIKHQH